MGTARLNFGTRTHFFGHGTPNFCRVNAKLRVRGPKNFKRAETSSGGSLGPPKNGSADQKLVTHAFCFSHCKNIVSVPKQNIEGKCGQTKPYLYLSSDIYYGHAYKEAIQLVFLLHSNQSPQQSEKKRNRI